MRLPEGKIVGGMAAMRFLSLVLAAGFLVPVVAQDTIDVARLGPQAGERAVPFSLPDQNGVTRTLTSLAGPNGTMLVFFRSADW